MEAQDAVDLVTAQWKQERPDVDVSPMAVVGRISRLSRLFERALKESFARWDLEAWEFDVLATLRRSGAPYELSAGALLKAALVTSGAMTNRIDRLEGKGLVERHTHPEDRRSVRIRLTAKGRKLADEVLDEHMATEERMLKPLSKAERAEFAAFARRLLISFGDTELH